MTVIMLELSVVRSDQSPLHEQVAAALRQAVAEGEALPGERLPPAKDFATVLGVNTNTVLRAFHQLRDEGILEFQRGRGITIAGRRGAARATQRALVAFTTPLGVNLESSRPEVRRRHSSSDTDFQIPPCLVAA
jgi:GntR family transcriptional regulator